MSRYLSDNINPFNASDHYTLADDLSGILLWLPLLEPEVGYQSARTGRVESAGDWLPGTDGFGSWCDGSGGGEFDSNEALFCHGDPGACKTCITSLNSLCNLARGPNSAVACFYFDFAFRKERTPTSIPGSLLKHIIGGLKILEGIVEAFRDRERVTDGRELRPPDIAKMLQAISASLRTLLYFDALDEQLLDSLREIVLKSPGTRIFQTERPRILDETGKRFAGRAASLSLKASKDDIIRYVRVILNMGITPEAMDSSLGLDVLKNIPKTVSDIFPLDSLVVEATLQEATTYRRRQKLSTMTSGPSLEDVYGTTLERMRGAQTSEKANPALATLTRASHSWWPLVEGALCHAPAVEVGSTDLNTKDVPLISTLLRCC